MRQAQPSRFTTSDGTALFYRHWPGQDGDGQSGADRDSQDQRAIVLLHRGHEHSGRLQHVVDELALPEVPCFAWDARGHGLSPGPRGHAPSFMTLVRDLDEFVQHIHTTHRIPLAGICVVAQSVGAVIAATWIHDYAPPIRGLILAAPAFDVRLYIPFAIPGLRLWQRLRGESYVTSYVKAGLLTHDPERIASFETDPLIARDIAVHILLEMHDTAARVVADASAIRLPVQLLLPEDDWVVRQGPQYRFFGRLGSARKECIVLPGFHHDTLGELDRGPLMARIRAFLLGCWTAPPLVPLGVAADREGYAADEFRALQRPLPLATPKGLAYGLIRLTLATLGRLSEGVRLGLERGFDSGSTLDYVYRDTAGGVGPLGRFLDRLYLDGIGWRGIRVRKRHVQELIAVARAALRQAGQPVRIVDIAAGHGRYVLDAVGDAAGIEGILLRDYRAENVAAGQALLHERGLGQVARMVQGDAFARDDLAALTPAPTLGIVSGLYELFPDNAPIAASLAGLAAAIPAGGYLLYTNQPWHPQLEFIARTLTSHRDGAAWTMRRRSQGEMDDLVRAAGFEKVAERIDEWGIFTVSLARHLG